MKTFSQPPSFYPNFSGAPIVLPSGTNILPLCNYPLDPLCINQWSQQALPLNVSGAGGLPSSELFVPGFIPSEFFSEMSLDDEDWDTFDLPTSRRSRRTSRERTFQVHKKDSTKMRFIEKDSKGTKTTTEGTVLLVPVDSLEPKLSSQQETSDKTTKLENEQTDEPGTFQITQDTMALPAQTKKIEPGCFILDKQNIKTEANFCEECIDKKNSVISTLSNEESFWSEIKKLFNKVLKQTKKKTKAQISEKDTTKKICSPETSLKNIIKNFNKHCNYNGTFEVFFKETSCKSCKKGVPPEIMMAMMSAESSGKCPAEAKNDNEHSLGLFQINAREHGCSDQSGNTYQKNTKKNKKCLKNPVNNLNKSIDILVDHYNKVNPSSLKTSNNCPSWLDLTNEDRDYWRRGVSAYNGGPAWVTRAIESATNPETLKDTKYLTTSQNHEDSNKNTSTWEQIRLYYFIEKLSSANTQGTGRKIKWTTSNLAHTEAILGRNIKNSPTGIVETWSQYRKNFVKKHGATNCN